MGFDWMTLIVAILSGTTVGSVYEAIKYRRENKRQKQAETEKIENEVKDNETDTQMKQMHMADQYFEGMLKMLEQVKASQDNGNTNQAKMIDSLDNIKTRVEDLNKRMEVVEDTMSNIVTYLNGDYDAWVKDLKRRVNLERDETASDDAN
ncbi:MAG: hypothetical protein J6X18_14760 [Bacteroidales bacterium]|nr:hypothetical protein [Bacteroidales bacterium]